MLNNMKLNTTEYDEIKKRLNHLSYNIEDLIERVDRIEPLVIDEKRLILNIDSFWNKIANIEREICNKDNL